jgi:hypothetical protein
MDMQDEAKKSALNGALAEGISTVNMAFASIMLSNGGTATTARIAAKAAANDPEGTDFTYAFSASATGVKVKVSGAAGGAIGTAATAVSKSWIKP